MANYVNIRGSVTTYNVVSLECFGGKPEEKYTIE